MNSGSITKNIIIGEDNVVIFPIGFGFGVGVDVLIEQNGDTITLTPLSAIEPQLGAAQVSTP